MKLLRLLGIFFIGGIAFAASGAVIMGAQVNPYTDKGDRLEIARQSSLEGAGMVSTELMKARPEVRLKKWNGEVDMGVRYTGIQTAGNRAPFTNRMEWKDAKQELHAYPLDASAGVGEDGGFEIEVVLNEKPASNRFDFTIDGADQLDFFYQPSLTQKEMDEGASRPENVVGSYAIYHKIKANHRVGSTNYATGKAYHIYRPKAFDANGAEAWAILSYTNGVLSVEVPQKFLDDAVYPVRVDPTFGYTTIGASTSTTQPFCRALINASTRYVASSGDTIISYSHYGSISSGSNVIGLVAYTWVSSVPSTRLSTLTDVTINSATAQWWTTGAVSQSLSNGTEYVVAFQKATSAITSFFDLLGGNGFVAQTSNVCDLSWVGTTFNTATYSIYATYTASAAAVDGIPLNNKSTIIIKGGTIIRGETIIK